MDRRTSSKPPVRASTWKVENLGGEQANGFRSFYIVLDLGHCAQHSTLVFYNTLLLARSIRKQTYAQQRPANLVSRFTAVQDGWREISGQESASVRCSETNDLTCRW
jgi:hypothetical protein